MGWVVNSTPRPPYPREINPVPTIRRLGGPHGRSWRVRKISLPPEFHPRTFQTVASRYTDCANPVTTWNLISLFLGTSENSAILCVFYNKIFFWIPIKYHLDTDVLSTKKCVLQSIRHHRSSALRRTVPRHIGTGYGEAGGVSLRYAANQQWVGL